jgi:hypothetical protein
MMPVHPSTADDRHAWTAPKCPCGTLPGVGAQSLPAQTCQRPGEAVITCLFSTSQRCADLHIGG